jgi:hypothetical protein
VTSTVPVTVVKSAINTCRSFGDPHIMTYDRLAFGFQKAGPCPRATAIRIRMHVALPGHRDGY